MRMNKIINLSLAAVAVGLIAACSVSTDFETTMEREIENTIKLKEKAKSPTAVEVFQAVRRLQGQFCLLQQSGVSLQARGRIFQALC